jgi:hypothetical protein
MHYEKGSENKVSWCNYLISSIKLKTVMNIGIDNIIFCKKGTHKLCEIFMTKLTLISLLILIVLSSCINVQEPVTFIVAADMRYTAKEEYRNSSYFQGACEAIKKYGKGSFMISPGDIDPPSAVYKVISTVLGKDYPWYPVVGNHELDDNSNMPFLRNINKMGTTLPNIVNNGPPGCIETTYSFDWGDNHFVVLNQYYDGQSDIGTDGDIVPELLEWLENDLSNNKKSYTFVFGHEPLIAIPDMDNGRLRHQDDSLNKYPISSFRFHQLLKKYNVMAYFCGHTHNASIAKINGIWQIDVGHARGIEAHFPTLTFEAIEHMINLGMTSGRSIEKSIASYYEKYSYETKKVLYYAGLTNNVSYKKLDDKDGLNILIKFYNQFDKIEQLREKYKRSFWTNANLTRSTFLKVVSSVNEVRVDFFRDDARGGSYNLMQSVILN